MEKQRIKVSDAARIMGVADEFIRLGIIKGLLPFGIAIKRGSKYTYYISPGQFAEYLRIPIEQLQEHMNEKAENS